ncbi:TPA: DUF551 domain-containing protein [Serratia marcescens]
MTLATETIKLWRNNAKITAGETAEDDPEHIAAKAILALTAEILANREAQPVLYASEETLAYAKEGEKSLVTWSEPMGDAVIPLYTAPPAPAVPDDYFGELVKKARSAADKAMRKFPQPNYVLNKVAEESGEVIKAVIHYTEGREEWASVEGEIIDNLAMLIRLVAEGDQVIGFTPPDTCRAAMLAQPVSQDYKLPEGWIACSERMPDNDETKPIAIYTGKCLGQGMFVATYDEDGFFDYWEGGEIIGVTHWMSLPVAPEGGNDHDTGR